MLQSERADLVPFDDADAETLLAVFVDPSVRRHLLDDSLVSLDWVRSEIASSRRRFANSGAGLWSIRPSGTRDIAGFAGFRDFFEPPRLQLLYGLAPRFWGRGLATEAARRVCEHAFLDLHWSRIEAATDLPNERSIRVLQRLGMRWVRNTGDGPDGTSFYELDRPKNTETPPTGV